MLITKLKVVLGALLAVGMVCTGTGVVFLTSALGQTAQPQAEQDEKETKRRGGKDTGRRVEQGRERPAGDRGEPSVLPPGIERLDLNEPQKDKLAKIQQVFVAQLEAAKQKHAEAIEQARQNQDRQKAEESNQAFRKVVTQLQEQAQGQIQRVLTEVQQRRLAELHRGQPGGRPGFELLRLLSQLDLSAEQREKVEKLIKEFGERHDAAQKKTQEAVESAKENQDRAKVRELIEAHQKETAKRHGELKANVQEILTEEQKGRLTDLLRQGEMASAGRGVVQMLPPPLQERLGLTPEQREKVAGLQKEMEGRLREILTQEQNRQVEQLRRGEAPPERSRPKE